MAFESGSLSVRVCRVPGGLPADAVSRFRRDAAPPVGTLGHGVIQGWVTSRHLLDTNIDDDTARVAGYLYLNLLQAERKIPQPLLRAECRMEELVELQARGVAFLKRSERAEIKKGVIERLLPQMPPTLRGLGLVMGERDETAYITATTDKQFDAMALQFRQTTGRDLIPLDPNVLALSACGVNPRDIAGGGFVPDVPVGGEAELGRDFLTWLWYASEEQFAGGEVDLGEAGRFGVLLEGPITLLAEGEGAHEATLRNGAPLVSVEARAALLAGKKVRRARLTLADADRLWSAVIDADSFVWRALKLPRGEAVDPVGRFEDRLLALGVFRQVFTALFARFLEERASESRWTAVCRAVQAWMERRAARA